MRTPTTGTAQKSYGRRDKLFRIYHRNRDVTGYLRFQFDADQGRTDLPYVFFRASKSESTISLTNPSKVVSGCQPSLVLALVQSPIRRSTSAGR